MSESTSWSWVPGVAAAYNGNVDYLGVPGVRFVPTYQELIVYYLQRKLRGEPLPSDAVHHGHDVYAEHPKKLVAKLGDGIEGVWYVFSPRRRKYAGGMRPNRHVGDEGHWKATGNAKAVFGGADGKQVIGTWRALTFHKDIYEVGSQGRRRRVKNKSKPTKWKMVELVCSNSCRPVVNNTAHEPTLVNPMLLNHCVLCKITNRLLTEDTDAETIAQGYGDENGEKPTSDGGDEPQEHLSEWQKEDSGGGGTQAAPSTGGAASHGNQQSASAEAPLSDDANYLGAQLSEETDWFGGNSTLPMPSILGSADGIRMTCGGQQSSAGPADERQNLTPEARNSGAAASEQSAPYHRDRSGTWRSGRIDPTLSNF